MDFLTSPFPISGKAVGKAVGELNKLISNQQNEFLNALGKRLKQNDFENFKMKKIYISDLFYQSINVRPVIPKIVFAHEDEDISLEFFVDVISALYHNFGRHMYGVPKHIFIRYIIAITSSLPGPKEEILRLLNQVTDFDSFKFAAKIFQNGINDFVMWGLPTKNFNVLLKFLVEYDKEGRKALELGWRNFPLWKLNRRLKQQKKLPIYKDGKLENFLWGDYHYIIDDNQSINSIKSLTPIDTEIAWNNIKGDGGSSILFEFHKNGVFKTVNEKYVPENLRGKVPKRVLSELFRRGIHLRNYYKFELAKILDYSKFTPAIEFAKIPTTWHDWILMEWLFQKMRVSSNAMFKKRTKYLHGVEQKYTYFSIIDEIQPEDLVNGINTKPDVAFAHSKERIKAKLAKENEELPLCLFKETQAVKQLKDTRSFIEEGKAMDNCVAGYIESAKKEHCFIYHIDFHNQHGTMEVDKEGDIIQLYGPYNDDPKPDVMYAVAEWLRINGLTVPEVIMDWRSNMKKDQRTHFDEVYNVNKMHYEDKVKA